MDTLRFLTPDRTRELAAAEATPFFVMDQATLLRRAEETLAFPNAFGLTVRYAMKANPTRAILQLFHQAGLAMDASSGFEVHRAIAAGIDPEHISLSAQELPDDLGSLIDLGVKINATSLRQLETVGRTRPGCRVGIRFNPGLGSGGSSRTNVGGPASAFGLWHDYVPQAQALLQTHSLLCERIHTHIGSGSDPKVWQRVAGMSLDLVRQFPDVTVLDLGGGYKVGRMPDEVSTDLQEVGAPVRDAFEAFAEETGRKIHLEIEPGTFLVANAGAIVCSIQDVIDTGDEGYTFYRTDSGMTDILRPSLYGAQHPLIVVPQEVTAHESSPAIVVGHCCESGDLLTPAPSDPEALAPRELLRAQTGDLLVIEGAGAYCSAMCAKNYNSFPVSAELLLEEDGRSRVIRQRQPLASLWADEC